MSYKTRGKSKRRRAKKSRNRQQMLSVNTVKAIAEEVCAKKPEVKVKTFSSANLEHASPIVIQEPTSAHLIHKILLDADYLTEGTAQGERVSDKIFLKGVRLKGLITRPKVYNNYKTSDGYQSAQYVKFVVRLIRIKKGNDLTVEPPDAAEDIVRNIWANQRDLNMTSAVDTVGVRFNNVWSKEYILRPKPLPGFNHNSDSSQSEATPTVPSPIFFNEYIPIKKHIRYIGSEPGDWKANYCLWVYAYNLNPHVPAGSGNSYWMGNADYCPHFNYAYSCYYSDA